MKNKKFIELITLLETLEWEYEVNIKGEFHLILGNQELICYKDESEKINNIIKEIQEHWL